MSRLVASFSALLFGRCSRDFLCIGFILLVLFFYALEEMPSALLFKENATPRRKWELKCEIVYTNSFVIRYLIVTIPRIEEFHSAQNLDPYCFS